MNKTFIYLLRLEKLADSLDCHANLLNEEDKQRWQTMKNNWRAKQLLASRVLLSHHFEHELNIQPSSRYVISNYKKWHSPLLKENYSISVSHSKRMVAVAIAPAEVDVGLDIELAKQRDFKSLLQHFATASEFSEIEKQDHIERYFYKLWTMKEAYLKLTSKSFEDVSSFDMSARLINNLFDQDEKIIFQKEQQYYWSLMLKSHQIQEVDVCIRRLVEAGGYLY